MKCNNGQVPVPAVLHASKADEVWARGDFLIMLIQNTEYDFGVPQYQDGVVERVKEHGGTDGAGLAQPDLATAEKVHNA